MEKSCDMNACKFSVIVPVYNAEKTIERSIQSLRAQSVENIEIILVNDGSTDRSFDILQHYATVDPRICVVNKKNGGVSSARNTGIKKAQGEFVLFCDSDDYVNEKWIENMYRATSGEHDVLPICGYCSIDKDGNSSNVAMDSVQKVNKKDFYMFCELNLFNVPWNKIFSRKIIMENSIFFDENLSLGEDLLFQLDYLRYVKFIVNVPEYLVYYSYGNEGSLSNKFRANMWENNQSIMNSLMAFMNQLGTDISKYEKTYYKSYFYMIVTSCKNNMKNSQFSFRDKIKANNNILKSVALENCMEKGDLSGYKNIVLKCYRSRNYFWVWAFEKIVDLKHKICG